MDEYRNNLPKKRMAVGLILRDANGSILILKPTYRDGWLIPGGVVEAMESPLNSLRRECQEELGISIQEVTLLAADYMDDPANQDESIHFIFESTATIEQLGTITLSSEHSEYQLLSDQEAVALTNPRLRRRLTEVLLKGRHGYIESLQPTDS